MTETAHKSLAEALLKFHEERPKLAKTATNPHFKNKFVPLDEVLDKSIPVLTKHGLVWTTFPSRSADGAPTLRYKLTHAATGQCEEGEMPLGVAIDATPQAQGSAITYARRYAMMAVLGLVGDEDDDGNRGSHGREANGAARMSVGAREAFVDELEKLPNAALILTAAGVSTKPGEWLASDAEKIRVALDEAVAA